MKPNCVATANTSSSWCGPVTRVPGWMAVLSDRSVELARLRDPDPATLVTPADEEEARVLLASGKWDGLSAGSCYRLVDPRPLGAAEIEPYLADVIEDLVRKRRREAIQAYLRAAGSNGRKEWYASADLIAEFVGRSQP